MIHKTITHVKSTKIGLSKNSTTVHQKALHLLFTVRMKSLKYLCASDEDIPFFVLVLIHLYNNENPSPMFKLVDYTKKLDVLINEN